MQSNQISHFHENIDGVEQNGFSSTKYLFNKQILFSVLILFGVLYINSTQYFSVFAQEKKPLSVGDMIAVSSGNNTVIYITDPKTKSLYSYKLTAESPERINLNSSFSFIPLNHEFQKPTSLAYYSGKLLICDEEAGSVLEADINTLEVKEIINSSILKEPESIAVSEKGIIAIGDDKLDKIVLFQEIKNLNSVPRLEKLTQEYNYDEVDRIVFVNEDLLILDSNNKEISMVEGPKTVNKVSAIADLNNLLKKFNNTSKIQDFNVYNGVYYLVNSSSISVFTPFSSQKTEKHQILSQKPVSRGPSIPEGRVAITKDYLLIKDSDVDYISKTSRPTPVSIIFEVPSTPNLNNGKQFAELSLETTIIQQRRVLAELYNYLKTTKNLPTREYLTTREFSNVRTFLLDEEIEKIILLDRPKPISTIISNKDYLEPISNIFCYLNPNFCEQGYSTNKVIPANQTLILPNIPVETDLTVSEVNLGRKTVKQHLDERVIDSQKLNITNDALKRLNKYSIKTVEQDFFNLTNATLILPATRWKVSVFVNAEDWYNKSSNFWKILDHPGIYKLSEEKYQEPISNSTSSKRVLLGNIQQDDQVIIDSYKILTKNINYYYNPTEVLEEILIGVAEDRNNVKPHPDLTGIWFEKNPTNPLAPPIPLNFSDPSNFGVETTNPKLFHPNHVGGIISSQNRIARGLAPNAKLFLINTGQSDSDGNFEQRINDAIKSNVRIFNLSFTIGGKETLGINITGDSLKEKFTKETSSWKGVLFVAAAGNEGKNLTSVTDRIFVKWSDEFPNIIGVGAVDNDNNILKDTECNPDDPNIDDRDCDGSNYGKKFVQIVAPGHKIYSTAFNKKYAPATGTSQAVPQVTSAAAVLFAKDPTFFFNNPSVIKARLIYTSIWKDTYEEEVWGGRLNFKSAVLHHDRNLITLEDRSRVFSLRSKANYKIKIDKQVDSCKVYNRSGVNGSSSECPDDIKFERVLRINRLENNLFRIIYLTDQNQLKILLNAQLVSEVISCLERYELDQLTNIPRTENSCEEFKTTHIYDYVSKVPSGPIHF